MRRDRLKESPPGRSAGPRLPLFRHTLTKTWLSLACLSAPSLCSPGNGKKLGLLSHRGVPPEARALPEWRLGYTDLYLPQIPRVPKILRVHHRSGS